MQRRGYSSVRSLLRRSSWLSPFSIQCGHGGPLGIVGEVLLEGGGGVLEKPRGGGEGVVLGVLAKLPEPGGTSLTVRVAGDDEVLLLLQLLPGYQLLHARALEGELLFFLMGLALGILLLESQLLGDRGDDIEVGARLAHGVDAVVFQKDGDEDAAAIVVADVEHLEPRGSPAG